MLYPQVHVDSGRTDSTSIDLELTRRSSSCVVGLRKVPYGNRKGQKKKRKTSKAVDTSIVRHEDFETAAASNEQKREVICLDPRELCPTVSPIQRY